MSSSNILLLLVLQFTSIELSNALPPPGQYWVPRVINPRINDYQNDRLPSVSSSLNAPNEQRETATLVVKPDQATTFLDIWTPYYLTIQRQNLAKRRGLVPFSHPTPRSIQFADGPSPSAAVNPDYPRRQAQHEYIQAFQSPGIQSQYRPQEQRQDVQVISDYPQQVPQQYVQLPKGVVYPQQVQQQYIEASAPSGVVPLSPAIGQFNAPLRILPIVPTAAATVASPLRQSFDDETSAPNYLQAQYTLPTIPPVLYPVISPLKQSFEEETSTAATVPVAANAAVLVPAGAEAYPAAGQPLTATAEAPTLSPIATASVAAAPEASSTGTITTAAPSPPNANSHVAPVVFGNGYALDPSYSAYEKRNLPLSFKSVGDQVDRLFSSVNMKELIKSGQNVIDLSTQGLGNLFGLPNPTKIQPTLGFGVLGKKR